MSTKNSGTLFIIAAPSGAGKTSLVKALSKKTNNLSISTSHTTRQPREYEREGEDYFFIEEREFSKLIEEYDKLEAEFFNKILTPGSIVSTLFSGITRSLERK